MAFTASLNWTRIDEWRYIVADSLVKEFAPTRDRHWLLSVLPSGRDWDDPEYTTSLQKESNIDDVELAFSNCLPSIFATVRLVHLYRPVNLQSYWTHGIVRHNSTEMQKDLARYIMSVHPEVTNFEFDHAIRQLPINNRDGRVFLGVDERCLLEIGEEYAVYGSEYQRIICQRIVGDGRDYSETLKARGRPACVVVNMPLSLIDDGTRFALSRDIIRAALWSFRWPDRAAPKNGFGFSVAFDIPPVMIAEILEEPFIARVS